MRMTATLNYVVYSAILTWVAYIAGSTVRNKLWTLKGYAIGMGNRDDRDTVLPATVLSRRFDRASVNQIESFLTFAALAIVAHVAGMDNEQVAGAAMLYFWTRVVYMLLYYAGVPYVRTLVWFASVWAQITIIRVLI
jgi:uncharacterized MAPEG superfamily protein